MASTVEIRVRLPRFNLYQNNLGGLENTFIVIEKCIPHLGFSYPELNPRGFQVEAD